jgi:hypothetical protein
MSRSRLSILSNASAAHIIMDPYPHLVIENALDRDVFDQLACEYPEADIVLGNREKKDTWYDYPACLAIDNSAITPFWREFMQYHVSPEFYADVIELFGDAINACHPDLESALGKSLDKLNTAMRYPEREENARNRECDLSMECQFYINYTEHPRAVRGPHVDRPTELYAALLYFRQDDDTSTGSDLEVCEAKNPKELYPKPNVIKADGLPMEVEIEKVNVVSTTRYKPNTLVFFINSARSLHAVSPRTATAVPRKHINFTADLFNLPEPALFLVKHNLRNCIKKWLEHQPVIWRLSDKLGA